MITLRSPVLRQLHAYWNGKRGDSAAPRRDEIDPTDIPRLLPHVFLIEAMGEPTRFRYRLIGTEVVKLTGRDLTGRFVDESLGPDKLAAAVEPYLTVIRQRRPVAKSGRALWIDKREWLEVEVLLLPLAGRDDAITTILGSIVRPPPRTASPQGKTNLALAVIEDERLDWGVEFSFDDG